MGTGKGREGEAKESFRRGSPSDNPNSTAAGEWVGPGCESEALDSADKRPLLLPQKGVCQVLDLFFDMGSLHVVLNSKFSCLCLQNTGTIDMHLHA